MRATVYSTTHSAMKPANVPLSGAGNASTVNPTTTTANVSHGNRRRHANATPDTAQMTAENVVLAITRCGSGE